MTTLQDIYNERLAAALRPDPDQARAIAALDRLRGELATVPGGWRQWLGRKKAPAPKGYYFHGGVGRGKSMLMDLFFASVEGVPKRRVHFHAFMLEVHDFLHATRTGKERIDGALLACADKIAAESRLLCFDEFQVRDVADAMILGRLFTALFERGVTMVVTSNVAPDDLYADGLQRDRFLPFIALLKERLHVFSFAGDVDYRLNRLMDAQLYFWPDDDRARSELERLFGLVADGEEGSAMDIAVKGRTIHVPRAVREVAAFTFAELCEKPKSALDYLELAKRFRVFVLSGVPAMTDEKRDAALRFVTLIDALYESHARLIVSAAVAPENLYQGETHAGVFARTVSRLMEMQSRTYREKV